MRRGGWALLAAASTAALASGGARASDKPLYQPIPGWVKPAPAIDAARLGDDAPIIVLYDQQERLADATIWSYHDVGTRMATPEVVAQAGTISLVWSPAKGDLAVHRVEIIRGAQHIDALAGGKTFTVIRREQQLERQSIDGQLTATLAVEGLQVGDILHVTSTTSNHEDALGGAVQDVVGLPAAPLRVGYARARLVWPAAADVKWKVPQGATPQLVTGGAERELVLLGALPKERDLPSDAPARFHRLPMIEATSFADWGAVSKVMAPLYATDRAIKPGGALATEVAAIAAAQTDPLRRADAALELVQGKVRYLFNGLDKGNYVPQTPEQTWSLRYGDCKAKTVLLLAILRALDVSAEPVLANLSIGDLVAERLPSAAAFNHVLVRATIGGRDYWLDGTGAGARYADIGDTPPLRWVLPIRADGAALLKVPAQAPARGQVAVAVDIDQRAGLQLPAVVKVTATVRGPNAAQLGLIKTQGSKDQKQEAVQKMVTATIGVDATVATYTIAYDPVEAVATVAATGTATDLWSKVNDRYRLTLDKTVGDVKFDPDRARAAWQAIPVATPGPGAQEVSVRVQLPDGGRDYTLDGDTAIAAPLGSTSIRRSVKQADGHIEVTDLAAATGAELAPAEIAPMRTRVALAKTRLLTVVAPAALPQRWELVKQRRADGGLKPILATYSAAIVADPESAEAYNNRANFLVLIDDWKGAAQDYDKAIALAPTEDRYLSRAYVERVIGADAKALADLHAARDLAPASPNPTEQLATYLVEHGHKDTALTMLQEGIDAGGVNRARLTSAKADVLARAGDRDAALASMEGALAIKPNDPGLLNERCWLKGRLRVQLDTALKDCTKSIELSESTSAALDSRALVYFRLNRFDDALGDLKQVLDEHPEQAGSLYLRGIILTRQGKTAEASRAFSAATFENPLVPLNYKPFGIVP